MDDNVQRVLAMARDLALQVAEKCKGDETRDCYPCDRCIEQARELEEAIYQLRWVRRP